MRTKGAGGMRCDHCGNRMYVDDRKHPRWRNGLERLPSVRRVRSGAVGFLFGISDGSSPPMKML